MNLNATTPLKKNIPLYQQAYQELKKAILMGSISPGSKIIETMLADQLQISRTPLREAIRQLQIEGLLITDNTSTTVVELNQKDFEELCQCRLILEKQIIQLAIDTIRADHLKEMEAIVVKTDELIFEEKHIQILMNNSRFHEILIHSCTNKRLVQLLEQVRSFLLLYRANILKISKHNIEINREHRNILEALKERNVEKAVKAIEIHLHGDLIRGKECLA